MMKKDDEENRNKGGQEKTTGIPQVQLDYTKYQQFIDEIVKYIINNFNSTNFNRNQKITILLNIFPPV
jgi:hypothetical protein